MTIPNKPTSKNQMYYKDLADKMKAYLKELEKLSNEDPKKAREVAKESLIKAGVLDKNGEEKEKIVTESHLVLRKK